MITLTDLVTNEFIQISDDLMWVDEFEWNSLVSNKSYSLTGALIIQQSYRAKGRPITLKSSARDMGWVSRMNVEKLHDWSNIPNREFRISFGRVGDGREFKVMFDQASESVVSASPVKEFPSPLPTDPFYVNSIKLIEV